MSLNVRPRSSIHWISRVLARIVDRTPPKGDLRPNCSSASPTSGDASARTNVRNCSVRNGALLDFGANADLDISTTSQARGSRSSRCIKSQTRADVAASCTNLAGAFRRLARLSTSSTCCSTQARRFRIRSLAGAFDGSKCRSLGGRGLCVARSISGLQESTPRTIGPRRFECERKRGVLRGPIGLGLAVLAHGHSRPHKRLTEDRSTKSAQNDPLEHRPRPLTRTHSRRSASRSPGLTSRRPKSRAESLPPPHGQSGHRKVLARTFRHAGDRGGTPRTSRRSRQFTPSPGLWEVCNELH